MYYYAEENGGKIDTVVHVLQYLKSNEPAIKNRYDQFHHQVESKRGDNFTEWLWYCLQSSEYICINVLYPFYLPFLWPNCLWSVTLHVRKNVKQMLSLSAGPLNSLYVPPPLD